MANLEVLQYTAIRLLCNAHRSILNGEMQRAEMMKRGIKIAASDLEILHRMAEQITDKTPETLQAELSTFSANVTLEDAKREKALAQALCKAKTERAIKKNIRELKAFFAELQARSQQEEAE